MAVCQPKWIWRKELRMKFSIFTARSVFLIAISNLFEISTVNAQTIWKPLSDKKQDFQEKYSRTIRESKGLNKKSKLISFERVKSNSRRNQSIIPRIVWEKAKDKIPQNRKVIKWVAIKDSENSSDNTGPKFSSTETILAGEKQKDIFEKPTNFKDAERLYRLIKPKKEDFYPPLRLGPSLPTANQLQEEEIQLKAYSISTFTSGSSGGTANQNYALNFDYGLTRKLQFSTFYSIADDPLFAKMDGYSSQPENYWESLAASLKMNLLKEKVWKVAIEGSLEGWNVGSGGPNIFNDSGGRVLSRNVIGSISVPFSWQKNENFEATFTPGIAFLPSTQGKGWGGAGDFYGNNVFLGTGFVWKPVNNLGILSSAILPFGPGYNSFDSNVDFSRNPIINFGINWDLNPRIGLEGLITNGFGATPSTGILTIPSDNAPLYYAGLRYTPYAMDTPQRELTDRENALALGGMTVNTALVPSEGTTQIWANADTSGNIFGYLGHSLSNILQLDIINLGSFNNVPTRGEERGDIVNFYADDKGISTRFGTKFVLLSPLRNAPFWTSARLSFGRNQSDSHQGYLFAELINTWEATNWLAININPKIAWNNISTPYGVGLGGNIQLSKRFQLIPEVNLVNAVNGDNNGTLALRWLTNENLHLDLYVSSAAGLLDIGQFLGADEARLGARFHITY